MHVNGCMGHLNACNRKDQYNSNRTVSGIDLPTALLEYINLNRVDFSLFGIVRTSH